MTEVWHSGLQTERTALAWRRTCLSMLTASAVALRLGLLRDAGPAIVVAGASLLVWSVLALRSRARYRATSDALLAGRPYRPMLSGGWAATGIVLLAVSTLLLALG